MEKLIRRMDLAHVRGEEARQLLRREWLVTNGLGGYASGTISGTITWRYHGLLIAALPAPFGRMVMLNHLTEHVCTPEGKLIQIGGDEPSEPEEGNSTGHYLSEFRLENGLPVWRFEARGITLERQLVFIYGQNTVYIHYRLLSEHSGVRLLLRPAIHFRGHEQAVDSPPRAEYRVCVCGDQYEIRSPDLMPRLRLVLRGQDASFTYEGEGCRREIYYRKEAERGYQSRGSLWSPGYFAANLNRQQPVTLIASTEWWGAMLALTPEEAFRFYHDRHQRLIGTADPAAHHGTAAELVLAGDQFIINPVGRTQDSARAHAAGDEIRTVIAGYHWFTDWGRDTMISLEGLTLSTRRFTEAGWILRTFAYYIRDGLIPNLFPEGKNDGLYHTADATLWFFHALARYVEVSGDRATLRLILPKLKDIVEHHLRGTRFGIHVDPKDGLLAQGAPGYQLTWMDAKVDDWVVTPRRGKAVEINGLWYNALRVLEQWLQEEGDSSGAAAIGKHADRCRSSFNQRFWNQRAGYLYDVIDGEHGDDASCRPNQLLAFSLPHPVLDQQYWEPVLKVCRECLVTPVGLRSLSPDNPDFKPKYFGDLRARDAAYHQGTVWAWLLGPFVDAWLKVYPSDHAGARKFLDGFGPHLDDGCVGSINEIFDAEPPFTPRGCIAQAWSVAEVLRALVKTAPSSSKS